MDENELRLTVYDALYHRFQGDGKTAGEPTVFVGLQGDKIVIMQPGGWHYAVLVVPARIGAPDA